MYYWLNDLSVKLRMFLIGPVYNQHYKAVLDGMETDSIMEIDPAHRIEIFRMGNGSDEVLEVHDFKHGITGIWFAKHQRCYIKTQTTELPKVTEVVTEVVTVDTEILPSPAKAAGYVNVGSARGVWGLRFSEASRTVSLDPFLLFGEPIVNPAFLLNSKIWEICQELPIHWIHPSPMRDAEFHEVEVEEDIPDAE
ncbi:unnamed protein product, partial [Coregonus sp. 'balchen']